MKSGADPLHIRGLGCLLWSAFYLQPPGERETVADQSGSFSLKSLSDSKIALIRAC